MSGGYGGMMQNAIGQLPYNMQNYIGGPSFNGMRNDQQQPQQYSGMQQGNYGANLSFPGQPPMGDPSGAAMPGGSRYGDPRMGGQIGQQSPGMRNSLGFQGGYGYPHPAFGGYQ